MNSIFINNNEYKVPGSFDELTKEQLLNLTTILFSGMEKIKARLFILYSLVSLSREDLDKINDEHVYDMLQVTDFALEECKLTKNLIPEIILKDGKILYGPSSRIGNVVFIEFINAEALYLKYLKNKDVNDLNSLIATIYRPRRTDMDVTNPLYDGDIRERFNDALVKMRAGEIQDLPANEKNAIFLFYQGCREYVISCFKELFDKEDEVKKSRVISQGWIDVAFNLAGDKFGTFEETCFTRLYTIMGALRNHHNEKIRMEEEIERRK